MEKINYLLGYEELKIYQDDNMFKFSIDSILLSNFVSITNKCKKILDIGTGNAIIPIVLTRKTSAKIDGVELQSDVFDLAQKSVNLNKLNNQINLYNEDIKEFYKKCETNVYDTITCNPPFFKINEQSKLNISNYKQLARHELSLDINNVMVIAKKLLKNNGNIAIVHRSERLIDIIDNMKKNNIEPKKIQFIYPKKNKNSNIVLIEGTKNGNPGVKILDPLYLNNDDGSYTNQVIKYFK